MGGLFSAPEPSAAPRSFYLVLSGPAIRHERPGRGPLIFHVNSITSQSEELVEHAEVVRPSCSFPGRQPLSLEPVHSHQANSAALTFVVDAVEAPYAITVYTEASLVYRTGEGVVVQPKSQSQQQFVAMRETSFVAPEESGRAQRYTLTVPNIQVQLLTRVSAAEHRQRLDGAPIVVVVEYVLNPPSSDRDESAAESVRESAAATPTENTSSRRAVSMGRQIICLNIGENKKDLTVLKQLLVHHGELFELDEVYGLDSGDMAEVSSPQAQDEDAAGGAAGDGDEEEENVCVVCLTNPRDTMILPCRHLCLCSECAGPLKQQTNKCPMCRAKIDRLMTR